MFSSARKLFVLVFAIIFIVSSAGCSGGSQPLAGAGEAAQTATTPAATAPEAATVPAATPAVTAAYPLTITDAYDRTVTLGSEPQKIISIAPNITEIIYALNSQDKLIGRSEYCDYPEEVKNIPSVGSIQDPGIEKIVELKPDLPPTSRKKWPRRSRSWASISWCSTARRTLKAFIQPSGKPVWY